MHTVLNISFFLFYEGVYHSCLASLRLMVTVSHCEHAVLMVRRGKLLPPVCTPHHHCLLRTNHTVGGGNVGSVGYLPGTHQSCLTSPAVPALLIIILSTANDSYLGYYHSPQCHSHRLQQFFTHHWMTVIPANVIPSIRLVSFPSLDHRPSCLLEGCLSRQLVLCHFCLLNHYF